MAAELVQESRVVRNDVAIIGAAVRVPSACVVTVCLCDRWKRVMPCTVASVPSAAAVAVCVDHVGLHERGESRFFLLFSCSRNVCPHDGVDVGCSVGITCRNWHVM